ncbi:uncharacterized protein LOC134804822 isoform X1 [Cydia splendana]|uniref:uncharacterized protein LOC134804822 isoform X1 n=1 Tax=Cydia splendana TaxID=1100963 RepID=UPI0028F48D9E
MLCVLTIFVGHWLIISCNEMLPVLRLNEPNRVHDGDPCGCVLETGRSHLQKLSDVKHDDHDFETGDTSLSHVAHKSPAEPVKTLEAILSDYLYGRITEGDQDSDEDSAAESLSSENYKQFPSGRLLHSEMFLNKTGVHLPSPDLLHTGHCRLRLTPDYLQTAVDAFAIILEGSLADVRALPADYVLRSARTISIMKLPQEKLSAMWDVVLNGRKPREITYKTLEIYRPLFKYLSGQQMAQLNLNDPRIVNYIGTHPELTRHQVGVVASKYIKINPNWRKIASLNNMNNLLCGVPMTFMRKLDGAEYLKLEHQVFYHIRACDPLQKRFYLNMMTRTQALGKSYSWSARDVSRLGLLLAEVEGSALANIDPEAMAGVSAHVMAEMRPENIKHLRDLQIKYLKRKVRNIMSRKLKEYDALMADTACRVNTNIFLRLLFVLYSKVVLIN